MLNNSILIIHQLCCWFSSATLGKLMGLLFAFVFIVERCTLQYDESRTAACLHLIVIWNCRPYPVNEGKSECCRKRSTIDFIQTSTAQFQLSATIGFHAGNTTVESLQKIVQFRSETIHSICFDYSECFRYFKLP